MHEVAAGIRLAASILLLIAQSWLTQDHVDSVQKFIGGGTILSQWKFVSLA